jgi:hypothetical protein
MSCADELMPRPALPCAVPFQALELDESDHRERNAQSKVGGECAVAALLFAQFSRKGWARIAIHNKKEMIVVPNAYF